MRREEREAIMTAQSAFTGGANSREADEADLAG